MTLREILSRVKPEAQEPSLVAKVRQLLSSAKNFPEHQVYPVQPESKWATIITQDLCINLNDISAVGVTAYNTGPEFFEALKDALGGEKGNYIMEPLFADGQGWRVIYACATGEDEEAFLLCANWYAQSREVVKKLYQQNDSDAPAAAEANTTDTPEPDEEPDVELF